MALFPDDGSDTDSLLQGATLAMERAREKGGDAWDVHAPGSRARAAQRQARETALQRALVRGGLQLYWQPVVTCDSGAIAGVESLLRWRGGERAPVASDFVTLTEVGGLAVPLGQWLLRAACRQLGEWRRLGYDDLVLGVSISARQLAHTAFVKLVRRVLDEGAAGAGEPRARDRRRASSPRRPKLALERLGELRALGIRVALDAFGASDSRLGDPHRFPLDSVRIDPAVVRDAVASADHAAVIRAAIALARSRKLRVIAAGARDRGAARAAGEAALRADVRPAVRGADARAGGRAPAACLARPAEGRQRGSAGPPAAVAAARARGPLQVLDGHCFEAQLALARHQLREQRQVGAERRSRASGSRRSSARRRASRSACPSGGTCTEPGTMPSDRISAGPRWRRRGPSSRQPTRSELAATRQRLRQERAHGFRLEVIRPAARAPPAPSPARPGMTKALSRSRAGAAASSASRSPARSARPSTPPKPEARSVEREPSTARHVEAAPERYRGAAAGAPPAKRSTLPAAREHGGAERDRPRAEVGALAARRRGPRRRARSAPVAGTAARVRRACTRARLRQARCRPRVRAREGAAGRAAPAPATPSRRAAVPAGVLHARQQPGLEHLDRAGVLRGRGLALRRL